MGQPDLLASRGLRESVDPRAGLASPASLASQTSKATRAPQDHPVQLDCQVCLDLVAPWGPRDHLALKETR